MMKTFIDHFDAKEDRLIPILDRMEQQLNAVGADQKAVLSARFKAEDLLGYILANADEGAELKLTVRVFLGNIYVRMSCKGREFDYEENLAEIFGDEVDEESRAIISSRLLQNYQRDVDYSYSDHINQITITVSRRKKNQLFNAGISMTGGVLVGMIIKFAAPPAVSAFFVESVFSVAITIFLHAMKMLIAFLVFFSICSGIAGFSNLKELGRVFGRVVIMFAVTSVCTLAVTYGLYRLIPIGNTALRESADASVRVETMTGPRSVSDMLINIVPENVLEAFLNTDMLQLLFLAILVGIAATKMEGKAAVIRNVISTLDEFFQKITLLIVQFMPACIFCSMASMVIRLKLSDIRSVAEWMAMVYFCDIVIIILMLIMVKIITGTSPVWYLRQTGPVMISGFSMASSNAVMPMTMQMCKEKLGISPKIYSFSIPLGIVINMDGGCVTLLISTLFLAKVYGVSITAGMLVQLFFSVFMLSVAAPAVPGGILLCLTILLPQMGIPLHGISIIIGLYFLVSMVQTMTNITSTVACSYVVSKRSRL